MKQIILNHREGEDYSRYWINTLGLGQHLWVWDEIFGFGTTSLGLGQKLQIVKFQFVQGPK